MIFETHAHYDDERFEEDRDALITSMPGRGVGTIINVGASIESTKTTLALSEKYPFVYGAIGVHPNEVDELNEDGIAGRKENSVLPKIVAVGEIGLDYYWDEPGREVQKKWFLRQLELAWEVKLPVVIHSRDAAKDTLDIMKSFHAENLGGVIHCFSYTKEMAREYLNMGFYLGIGGVVTFKNAKKLKEVVEYMPMEQMVLETDCPYLSPVPNRGKRNSSLNLPYVVEEVARLKGISADEVIEITNRNAKTMYRL